MCRPFRAQGLARDKTQGIAAGAVEIAKILFFIFAIMAVISFVVGLMKRR